ncbi:DEP domain-containing protein 4 isoform X2 [Callorhinchus milii]|uniref:DEP domain-containing protein 4 isoform X2 n=1 Tax=Callorhinchus milii TaxID=7868 RepID=UPI001C3FB7B8|nr:DEP domain-containing protein 4 isoform X2 [Callorhinchus milii]
MAVNLTPRFRRLESSSSLRVKLRRTGRSGPFCATKLWNNIIHALQTQVEVKRHRRFLRTYSDCFSGSDAVDVVLSHLMQNVYFSNNDISRIKATRLCQALMDHKVFDQIGTKLFTQECKIVFEDSNSMFYKFLDNSTLLGAERDEEIENVSPGRKLVTRKKFPKPDQITISNPVALESCDKRIEELFQTINLHPSLPPNLKVIKTASLLSTKVVNDVWKQETLLLLLRLIDLPVLDSILESPLKVEPRRIAQCNQQTDLIISNTFLDREVTQSLNLSYVDKWLLVAIDCLQYFPDQLIVLVSQLLPQTSNGKKDIEEHKKLLFETIAKYYSQDREQLLASRYFDIHSGIIDLLECGKTGQALEATQLCLRLLEPNCREELHSLLSFMAVGAHPEAYKLQKQNDNRTVMIKTFTKAIIQSKALSKIQTEELVMFLMDNHTDLFKIPTTLLQMVRKKLLSLQEGEDPDYISGFTFCQHVTQQEFEEQKHQITTEHLQHLVQDISQNSNTSTKNKKKLLRELQKHHPLVFLQYFENVT